MTLHAAIVAVESGDAQAWKTIWEEMGRMARAARICSAHLDDVVQDVLAKLVQNSELRTKLCGFAPPRCDGYVRRMLTNRHATLHRGEGRRPCLAAAASPAFEPPISEKEWGLLQRACDHAVRARMPRYREALRTAWADIVTIVRGDATLEGLLRARGQLSSPDGAEALRQARNRAYKAHERARAAVAAAIDDLEESGELGEEDATVAREALARCQRRGDGERHGEGP